MRALLVVIVIAFWGSGDKTLAQIYSTEIFSEEQARTESGEDHSSYWSTTSLKTREDVDNWHSMLFLQYMLGLQWYDRVTRPFYYPRAFPLHPIVPGLHQPIYPPLLPGPVRCDLSAEESGRLVLIKSCTEYPQAVPPLTD